jgi:hypothetical protein
MKLFILEVKNIDLKQGICMLNERIASRERVVLHLLGWSLLLRCDLSSKVDRIRSNDAADAGIRDVAIKIISWSFINFPASFLVFMRGRQILSQRFLLTESSTVIALILCFPNSATTR